MTKSEAAIDDAPRSSARNGTFPGQHEGETIYFVFRQHPLVMRKALIYGCLVILAVIVPLDFPFAYTVPGLASFLIKMDIYSVLAVFLYWFYRWCLWYYSVFIVTGERTVSITYKSFFRREVRALFHGSVHGVDYIVPGLQGAMFGYGNIVVYTWVGNFPIDCVHHPAELHEKILDVIRGSRENSDSHEPVHQGRPPDAK
jgi:hypothetical protein